MGGRQECLPYLQPRLPLPMEIGPAVDFQNGPGSGPLPTEADSQPPDSSGSQPNKVITKEFLWIAIALAAMTVAVYAPVWHFGFVGYDDLQYVTDNQRVLRGLTWDGVKWAFSTGYFSNWHPLTWISLMLDAQMYGKNAGGFHLTSVLFHIANTLLLFGLLIRMTGKMWRSAFVAGLFAVHPLHVESVAWVSERKDVLSTLFGLLALWAYVGYAERPRRGRYLLVLLFFGLSLMSKSMLVTFPFLLLLLDVWPMGRIAIGSDAAGHPALPKEEQAKAVRLVAEKLPLLVLTIASCVVTIIVQDPGGLIAFPVDFRIANAVVAYVAYILKMLWPAKLAAVYPYPDTLAGWQVFGSLLVLIVISAVAIPQLQRRPFLTVGWLWFMGMLVPAIGLVQVGSQAMADRYTYVPLIGLFLIAAWGIPELLTRWPHRRIVLLAAACVVISACMVTARAQVHRWESDATLWRHALIVTTGNYLAHHNLGTLLASEGRLDEAVPHYVEAIRLKPDYADAYTNLGLALMIQDRKSDALRFLEEAVRLNPNHAEAQNNLAVLLKTLGRFDEAKAHLHEALRIVPDYANAHYNLGNVLASQGKTAEAIAQYTQAVEISPENETIRSALEELRGRP